MFFFLLFLIIVIKCLTYVWGQRKIISLHFKLKNDIRCYPIIGHAYLFFGTNEDRMTTLQLLGKEAIKHGGLSKAWVVHKMFVFVADAKIAETIFRGCLEKSDLMKLAHNLVGNGSLIAPETTLDYQVDALRNRNQPFLLAFDEYCHMTVKRFNVPWYCYETVYSTVNWKIKKHIKIMHDFVDKIIKAKRKTIAMKKETKMKTNHNDPDDRRNTLLDLLINKTFNREGYTDVELREELLVIILAGSDTSATGVAFTLLMLAMYPDIQEKVYEEKCLYTATGLILPKDMDIIINLWAINRNPQYWGANAEQFDPTRFLDPLPHPAAFVSFSYGPRNCIGYRYALMSIKTVIATMLRRFRILPARESNGTKPPRVKYDVMMKDVDDFCIKLEKRLLRA